MSAMCSNMVMLSLLVLLISSSAYAAPPVTVTSVVPLGNQSDPHLAPVYPNRDGGAVGSLGGKIVWFWSDTTYTKNGQFAGFYVNTGALGTVGKPLLLNGPQSQAIPFTADEVAFNNKYSNNPRVVLWPKSAVVETSAGKGVIYVPKGYWGPAKTDAVNEGVVVCPVTIGADGFTSVTRVSSVPIFALKKEPSYGSVASTKDSKYVYLYSQDSIAQYTSTTFVARVPLESATNKSAFQYYNPASKVWESTIPAITDTSRAIFTTTFGLDGSVYYSAYHGLWLMIYSYHADYKVYLRTAVAPEGPWINDRLIYSPPPSPQVNYIYGTTATNLYDPTGKTSSVCFTWCYNGGYANWVAQVNFA